MAVACVAPPLPFDRADIATEYHRFDAQLGNEYIGTVIGGSDYCEFYVRPIEVKNDVLEQVNTHMDALYGSLVPSLKQLNMHTKGMPCAVRYVTDRKWYRAILEDTEYNMVRFVDYGNVQLCAEDDIKPLYRPFIDCIAPTTIPCKLTPAQDIQLPSFVNDTSKILITILSLEYPYEVAVKVLSQEVTEAINSTNAKKVTPSTDSMPLSTMPPRPSRAMQNDTDDDLKKGARASAIGYSRPGLLRNGGAGPSMSRYNIQNGVGQLSDMYATCAGVRLVRYPAKRFEINTEQTAFCSGPLQVHDLRRIFRSEEHVRFNAKLEMPYVTMEMEHSRMLANDGDEKEKEKKKKVLVEKEEDGRWLVTDFKPGSDNPNLLITHAVVTFVGDTAASLYVRGSGDTIWAPKGVFPNAVASSDRPLRDNDLVQIGRSVIVRAESASQFVDFKIAAGWMAKAVEFVGVMYEEQGWMYLIRENYSVIITDGNVGFGYVFVPNQYVESSGIKMEDWYGKRVYFRSCVDVPDNDEEFRSGVRMKALSARLDPNVPRGQYRYAGIYRPQSVGDFDDTPGARASDRVKKLLAKEDEAIELPKDVLDEMRMLGVDTIGIERPSNFAPPENVNMIADNVLNELRDFNVNDVPAETQQVPIVVGNHSNEPAVQLPVAPNVLDDDMELRSTVEIFETLEPVPIFRPLTPVGLVNGDQNRVTPTKIAGAKKKPKAVKPKIKCNDDASQTDLNGQDVINLLKKNGKKVKNGVKKEDPAVIRARAIGELHTMGMDEVGMLMEFTLKLEPGDRRRFYELYKASMSGN